MISGLNGQVTNSGTQHFACCEQCTFGERGIYLAEETLQSGYVIVEAANHRIKGTLKTEGFRNGPRKVEYLPTFEVGAGETCHLEKLVTIFTSRDLEFAQDEQQNYQRVVESAITAAEEASKQSFVDHQAEQSAAWGERWKKADIEITGNEFDQVAIRFAIFHLIQMTSWNDPRVSIAAKGLSGEGYRGHVFWDTEIFMLPFFIYSFPQVAKNLLMYRYLTLPGAMKKARENGYEGAMYAWESADTGEETTPKWGGLDLKTRKPIRIWCGELEQHISADIAYAFWHYYQVTQDREWMIQHGAEIICLIARFWKSRLEWSAEETCYEINNVIGPDEYAESVNNNYYTNRLVQWNLRKAAEICQLMKEWGVYDEFAARIQLTEEEQVHWLTVADQIKLSETPEGLLVQFDGFLEMKQIDVAYYKTLPGGLPSHLPWEEVTHSQVLKQADVVMLLYLLSDEYSSKVKRVNWNYYEPRTMHDSSLSAAIHSIMANEIGDPEMAYQYFVKAAKIDLGNNMGNSDHGMHAATQGGVWQAVVNGFAGVRVRDGLLCLEPSLPTEWEKVRFALTHQGVELVVVIEKSQVEIRVQDQQFAPVPVQVWGKTAVLNAAEPGKVWIC